MNLNVGSHSSNPHNTNFQVGDSGSSESITEIELDIMFDQQNQDTLLQSTQKGFSALPADSSRPDLPQPVEPASTLSNFLQTNSSKPNLPQQTAPTQEQSTSSQQATYAGDYNSELASYVSDNNLTSEDQAQLQFAFYNPSVDMSNVKLSDGSSLTQVLNTLLAKAQGDAFSQGVDVSKLNPPVDNTAFNLNISDGYNSAFEKAVNADPSTTSDQKATLIFMFYNPNVKIPNPDPTLTAKLQNCQATALKQTNAQFSTPTGWKPPLNSNVYNGALLKDFATNLQLELEDYSNTNGLTDDQITDIKGAIQNINDPTLSPDIKAAANKIINAAAYSTQTQQNLPVNWKPSSDQMSTIVSSISNNTSLSGFVQMRSMLKSASQKLELLMPASASKAMTMQLLESISAAVIKAQNSLYAVEQSNSQVAKNESTAKLGMMQQQIEEQQAEQKEMSQQLGKQQKMASVMKILGPIMKVLEVVMALATGGIFAMVFAILDAKYNFVDSAIKGICKGVSDSIDKIADHGDPNMERFKDALKGFTEAVVMATILCVGATAAFELIGPMALMNTMMSMITESDIVTDFCKMCDIPDKDDQWIVLAVGIAVTLAIIVISFIDPANVVTDLPTATDEAMGDASANMNSTTTVVSNTLDNANTSVQISQQMGSSAADDADNLNDGDLVDDVANTNNIPGGSSTGATTNEVEEEAPEEMDITDDVKVKSTAKRTLDDVNETVDNVMTKVMDRIQSMKAYEKTIEFINTCGTKLNINPTKLKVMFDLATATQGLVSAASSGVQGGIDITNANMAGAKKKYDPVVAELQAIIQGLEKILTQLLNGLSGASDSLNQVTDLLSNVLSGMEQTLDKTTSIQTQVLS